MTLLLLLNQPSIPAPFFEYRVDSADANYATTTTTGGIADSSGQGQPNAVPATAGVRPTLSLDTDGHQQASFDGVDDRLTTANATGTMLAFGNAKPGLTVSLVVKVRTAELAGTARTLIFFTVGGSNGTRIGLDVEAGGAWRLAGRRLDADATANLVGPAADGQWRHVVGVNDYANQQQRLYIDGVLVASQAAFTAGSTAATNGNAWSWGSNATPGQYAPAVYKEVRGHDRALTDAEVAALFQDRKTLYTALGTSQAVTADVTASASSTSTAQADLTRATQTLAVTASATSVSTAQADVTRPAVTQAVTGSATSVATGSANLTRVALTASLTASASSVSTASADVTRVAQTVALTGSATSTSTAAADIVRPGTTQALTASATSTAVGSADVSRVAQTAAVTASATSVSTGQAAATARVVLTGSAASVSTATADLTRVTQTVSLTASATSTTTAAADVTRVAQGLGVTASASSAATGQAAVTAQVRFTGSAASSATATADLTRVTLTVSLTACSVQCQHGLGGRHPGDWRARGQRLGGILGHRFGGSHVGRGPHRLGVVQRGRFGCGLAGRSDCRGHRLGRLGLHRAGCADLGRRPVCCCLVGVRRVCEPDAAHDGRRRCRVGIVGLHRHRGAHVSGCTHQHRDQHEQRHRGPAARRHHRRAHRLGHLDEHGAGRPRRDRPGQRVGWLEQHGLGAAGQSAAGHGVGPVGGCCGC